MAKKNLKKYKGGGINWKELGYGITNTGKAVADVGLSALGADDAISDQDYKGNSGTAFSKVSGTAGSVTKALVPTALAIGGGALAASMGQNPMMGAQIGMGVGKGIQGIGGAANPQNDPRGERSEIQGNMATNERLESSIYGLGDTSMALGKSIAPMIAQAESAGSARYGGIKKKCEDGGEVSKDHSSYYINENPISNEQRTIWGGVKYKDKGFLGGSGLPVAPTAMFPYGGTFQVNGPSHEEGGVEINSPNGEYEVEKQEVIKTEPGQDKILSDKLKFKPTGKTYAKEYKKYQTLVDLVNNPKKTVGIPDTFKKDIIAKADIKFNELFNTQEMDKQKRVNSYIKRLGGLQTFGDGGPNKKVIDRNAYASDFTRFEKQGAGNNDMFGVYTPEGMRNLGFKEATDITDQYPVWISKEGQYMIKHPQGYVGAGNAQSLRLQNFNLGNNIQSTTPNVTTTNATNNVNLTKSVDPNRLPYKFGSDYNFDPNTGKYFTGAAPLEDNSNIVNTQSFNFTNGGIKKSDNEGSYTPSFDSQGRDTIDLNAEADWLAQENNKRNLGSNITYKEHDIPKGTDWGKVGSELAMGVTQNMGNIYDINRGRNAETEKFDRLSFSKLDPTEALRQNMRSYAAAKKQIKEGSVGNASSYMTNVNQAYINRMNMDNKTRSDYNNANVGITNNERVANQSIDTQEKIANAQNRAMARNLTSSGLGNMGQNIAGQVADSKRTAADEKTLKMYMSYYNDPQFRKAMKDAGYVI